MITLQFAPINCFPYGCHMFTFGYLVARYKLRYCFFLSGFSFTDTDDLQDSRGKEETFFYFSLPVPPAYEYSDIYLQRFIWDDFYVFLIATRVYQTATWWDLPPYWITIWLIHWWCNVCLFTGWFESRFFVTAIWHEKPVDLNSHRLSHLYYKYND